MPPASDALKIPAAPLRWPWQPRVLAFALLLLAGLAALLARDDRRMAGLFLLGAALGVTLYHAAFGFTGAYRRLITERDTRGVRAQLVMLGAATLLFAPVLATGSVFGREVAGALAPVGWQVAAGAFLFGIGMQLGNGCGSGTLFTLGGGSTRMLVTLAAFVAGSFWASLDMGWWQALPSLPPIALGEAFGWPLGVALQIAFLLVLWLGLKRWGKPVLKNTANAGATGGWRIILTGPWLLLAGALALAGLNFVTLLIAGHPWTITWAFTCGAPRSPCCWAGIRNRALLNWHEIVNDRFGAEHIAVTFCPLCGTGIAYVSEAGGKPLSFGVSGLLYNSDVLVYDRQTQSLWSQILAQAVSGPLKGARLTTVALAHTNWADWKQRHPDTQVLSTDTGFSRDYTRDPYAGYTQDQTIMFPVAGRSQRYHPKEPVIGIEVGGKFKVYPFVELAKIKGGKMTDTLGGKTLTVRFDPEHRTGAVFDAQGNEIRAVTAFWFAWYAFHRDTEVFQAK